MSNWQTSDEVMEVVLVTVVICLVSASMAPKTLKRCRPAGAEIKILATDHSQPKNGAKTKCAASRKKFVAPPDRLRQDVVEVHQRERRLVCARSAFAGMEPTRAAFETEFEQCQTDLRPRAFETGKFFDFRLRLRDGSDGESSEMLC